MDARITIDSVDDTDMRTMSALQEFSRNLKHIPVEKLEQFNKENKFY